MIITATVVAYTLLWASLSFDLYQNLDQYCHDIALESRPSIQILALNLQKSSTLTKCLVALCAPLWTLGLSLYQAYIFSNTVVQSITSKKEITSKIILPISVLFAPLFIALNCTVSLLNTMYHACIFMLTLKDYIRDQKEKLSQKDCSLMIKKLNKEEQQHLEDQQQLVCPISLCLIHDPVRINDGASHIIYERQSIKSYMTKQERTQEMTKRGLYRSPMNRQNFTSLFDAPDYKIRLQAAIDKNQATR